MTDGPLLPGSSPAGSSSPPPPPPPALRRWAVRVDTGGTFTDTLARAPDGSLHRAKVLSTARLRGRILRVIPDGGPEPALTLEVEANWEAPEGFAVGMEVPGPGGTALGRVREDRPLAPGIRRIGVAPGEGVPELRAGDPFELDAREPAPLLAARLVTGTPRLAALPPLELRLATTRGTNALLERRGSPFALFVTRGFGDVLLLGDQSRPDLFALHIERPPPLPLGSFEIPGRLAPDGTEVIPLDPDAVRAAARQALDAGARGAAVSLLHAWKNPTHEVAVARILREEGFAQVVCSSAVAPFLHFLRRTETTAVEAFLAPVVGGFLDAVEAGAEGGPVLVMTSAGGLVPRRRVRACDTLLSGPAGGVLGALRAGLALGCGQVISFDMGGTSTDVARAHGHPDRVETHQVGDARLQAPAVAIETVAAGGGSICHLGPSGPEVGPHSAGADPGPACYGRGGPLTLTDVNLLLGRVDAERFGIPVDAAPALEAARTLARELSERTGEAVALEALLEGFLALADERMADAIRKISVQRGYDPADHVLVAFGGAGPQHAVAVAERLGMTRVLVPADAGILSAVGLDHAVVERQAHRQLLVPLDQALPRLGSWFGELEAEALATLHEDGIPEGQAVVRERILHLRYQGQEAAMEIPWSRHEVEASPAPDAQALRQRFEAAYLRTFGHQAPGRTVEVAALRVVAAALEADPPEVGSAPTPGIPLPPSTLRRVHLGGGWTEVPVFEQDTLPPGTTLAGPALVQGRSAGTVLPAGWRATRAATGTLVLERTPVLERTHGPETARTPEPEGTRDPRPEPGPRAPEAGPAATEPGPASRHPRTGAPPTPAAPGAVEEELFVQRFRALVEEMGAQLQRTALSVNIRERLDYSCGLLDPEGRLVVNAPHIPVHLGALGPCVRAVAEALPLGPGDVAVTNHPGFGGSHLPDVTVITPVFDIPTPPDSATATSEGSTSDASTPDRSAPDASPPAPRLLGYLASRAHHAELGGSRPGSMPPDARSLAEEGVVIAPRLLVRGGQADWEGMEALLRSPRHGIHPSRGVEENRVDLEAQVAANHRGAELLRGLARLHGPDQVMTQMTRLRARAGTRMAQVLDRLPDGLHEAEERLDDGTPLRARIEISGARASVSLSGSGAVHPGNLNATPAIATSAVLYLLRLLAGEDLPLNEGLLEPVSLAISPGILNPHFPPDPWKAPAVVGGNTETSQRLVDALLRALGLVAGSQGTMNNVLFGDAERSYYETVGGGTGAGAGFHGADGVQVHMTNTRITDVEVLEHRYPVRVERFQLRRGSGGRGRWHGGDGIVRELTFLAPLSLSVLGQHRVVPPYALAGGEPGATGRHRVFRADGTELPLAPVDACEVEPGDRLLLETPGGGGYGAPPE